MDLYNVHNNAYIMRVNTLVLLQTNSYPLTR